MNECACGVQRRKFWVWRDSSGVLHASSFKPTSGAVQSVIAATGRDALLPIAEHRAPKHQVHDGDNPVVGWEGRCSTVLSAAAG